MGTAITLAALGYGVWSVVWGMVIMNISQTLLFWRTSPLKLRLSFDWKIASELLDFGIPLFVSGLVWFLVNNIDNMVIGKVLGMKELGFYAFAFTIINLPATEIVYIQNRVMFPTFSRLSDSLYDLKHAYLKNVRYTLLLSIPISIGIPLFGGELFQALYGEKWISAIAPLQAFGIYAFMRTFGLTTGNIFLSLGKTKYILINALICLALFGGFIYPVTVHFGITGVAALLSIVWTVIMIVLLYWMRKLVRIKIKDLYRIFRIPVLASVSVMLPVKYLLGGIIPLSKLSILVPAIILIIIIYIIIVSKLDPQAGQSLKASFQQKRLVIL
jgi:O-antigen/teichoic acid export membrane protein